MSEKDQPPYQAYLLRCWQERACVAGSSTWRFALIRLDQAQPQKGFGNLLTLAAFLQNELSAMEKGKEEGDIGIKG